MHSIGFYLLWTLTACTMWHGSGAEDHRSEYVCLIDDPKPNRCESFCMTELRPLLDKVIRGQDDADNETKAKLDRLEVKIKEQEAQLTKIENQLQAILNKMEETQKVAEVENRNTIPYGFEKIGSRYFRIVHEYESLETAKRRCRDMGGSLALFLFLKDYEPILPLLETDIGYWLALDPRGRFPIPSRYKDPKCILLFGRGEVIQRWDDFCDNKSFYFICQLDIKN